MYDRCAACDEMFEREPGQWFGAIYINIGLSEGLAIFGFFLTQSFTTLPTPDQVTLWTVVAAVAPVMFFRFAKGLWTSIVFLGEGLYLDWPSR